VQDGAYEETQENAHALDRLEQLYVDEAAKATRLALVLTRDRHAAEDLVHDAFARVARRMFVLRSSDHARAYLYRTVVNLCRGHARRHQIDLRARKRMVTSSDFAPSIEVDQRDEIWNALMALPLRQRSALFFRYYIDLSEEDAAEALGCSASAVKSLVHRALKTLRTNLKESNGD
jgi:RNA polymerase sigma factor (sigma-70 family)